MDEVFIVMQIGNAELDRVCDEAIVPAITAAGFTARRVDRHNTGDLLKSEIVQFIDRAQIIVADLTNERPNCYLEVGYAMGLGKKANLILTSREDHHWSSPRFKKEGPRVHFDLEGYDILFWDPAEVDVFKEELTTRIRRRAAIVRDTTRGPSQIAADADWLPQLRGRGEAGLAAVGLDSYMEVSAEITPAGGWSQSDLLRAVRDSSISTFGWPIAPIFESETATRPRPTVDGVQAEISFGGDGVLGRRSYDFWKVFRDGRFYTLLSLFEDERVENAIFWDTRAIRITEALMLLARVYGASDTDVVAVQVRHAGLKGRILRVADSRRMMFDDRSTAEDSVDSSITLTLSEIEAKMVEAVRDLLAPLLLVFDFFEVDEAFLTPIVDGFVDGKIG